MTGPAPQTTASEINDGFNQLVHESDAFRSMEDARVMTLWDEATKLQKADARSSFSLRGSLSSICGLLPEMHEYFRKALLHPGVDSTRLDYWTALINVGLYSAASEQGSWLLEPRRHFFPTIWQRAAAAGQISGVWDRLPDAKQVFADQLSKIDFSSIGKATEVLKQSGTSDKQLFSVLDLMGEIQREHRIMFAGPHSTRMKVVAPPDEHAYVYLLTPLAVPTAMLREMNRKLSKLVVSKLPNGMFPPGLVASFEKAEQSALQAAA